VIIKILRSQSFPGRQVDYLCVSFLQSVFYLLTFHTRYVDEAQDNLLIDAFGKWLPNPSIMNIPFDLSVVVLRRLCRNPDGLFWAGDTAQTISAGSSFRFDDLKAFLYRVEVSKHNLAPKHELISCYSSKIPRSTPLELLPISPRCSN
jgi:hypothetical protein